MGRTAQATRYRDLVGQLIYVGIGMESCCSFVDLEFKYIILKGIIV